MNDSIETLKKRILAARGEIPSDLVLKGGKIVNVFSGEIQEGDVAFFDGIIVGVGDGYQGKEHVKLEGKWVTPGLIDGHIHIESSMLPPSRLAAELLTHGTTAIVSDPHEIANVLGLDGVRFMLEDSRSIPFDIFFMAPSCVPATHLETSGATLGASELSGLKDDPRILGLAEMMNFPGVIMGDNSVLEKINLFSGKIVDGHAPLLSGHDLQAYLTAGVRSDHESTQKTEGFEKVSSGMMLMIREGTAARDLEELLPLVNKKNSRRFCLVSDDLHAEDIANRGHLNVTLKKAVRLGLDTVTAIQLVTLNPAEYFGLKNRGAVAPGYCADLTVFNDLVNFEPLLVYKNGHKVVDSGNLIGFPVKQSHEVSLGVTRHKPLRIAPIDPNSLRVPHMGAKAKIIELVPGRIITTMRVEEVKSEGGYVVTDIDSDILKLCVVERHQASGRIGFGLVRGFGLKKGAIASSVAHDSHNVIAAGVSDGEILRAIERVKTMGGGLAVAAGHEILAEVPLEIAGLMSTEPLDTLVRQLEKVKKACQHLGSNFEEPFMMLSFLALPVIPELKLTDRGLVDVNKFEIVPLFSKKE